MPNNPPKWIAWCFASSILISAFLVFQVQPVISKTILPWFGGSPAVWTTCMLFFQVLLFCGYLYAHLSVKYLKPAWQGGLHILLVIGAVMLLPIMPDVSWKPSDSSCPTWRILLLLGVNVGLPYFILSSTAPLVQSWFSKTFAGKSPYRLYALSNAGSLVALLSYPFLFEPALAVQSQAALWTLGFCVFALFCGVTALYFRRHRLLPTGQNAVESQARLDTTSKDVKPDSPNEPEVAPGFWRTTLWLVFPAFASVMLLATTNHICQDVAVTPFLWVAPLSLYLLTFIICFDNPKWYSRSWCSAGTLVSILSISLLLFNWHGGNLFIEVAVYLFAMFFICMLCHGELVRYKPATKWLTKFYLMSAAGGALGGSLVALVCPAVFTTYYEMNLAMLVGFTLAGGLFLSTNWKSWAGSLRILKPVSLTAGFVCFLFVVATNQGQQRPDITESTRNFYGVLAVVDAEKDNLENRHRVLFCGRIVHGIQWMAEDRRRTPTSYYIPQSGVGLALNHHESHRPRRIGIIGLGIGTLATYGKKGDYYRFYEINPDVHRLAQDQFTFLKDCAAEVDVALGDARLLLEQEENQQFDVLVIDAFSGDAVPAHLLTAEAMSVYQKHLKRDSVLAFHVTNRHIDLYPVVKALAENANLACSLIEGRVDHNGTPFNSQWMLMSNNQRFLRSDAVLDATVNKKPSEIDSILWTDGYSNLVSVLK